MHRRSNDTILRLSLGAALALTLGLLTSCGVEGRGNPLAPDMSQSSALAQAAKNSKHIKVNGRNAQTQGTSKPSGPYSGGVTQGFSDPGDDPSEAFVTE